MTLRKSIFPSWPSAIAALLIFLFVYTATSKLIQHQAFYARLTLFPWIDQYAGLISWLIPTAEILVSIMLLSESLRLLGFFSSLFLLILFSVYLVLMLGYHDKLPCTCGGVIEKMTWKQHMIFNLAFILITFFGIYKEIWPFPLRHTKSSA